MSEMQIPWNTPAGCEHEAQHRAEELKRAGGYLYVDSPFVCQKAECQTGWIRVEPGYQQPRDSEMVLVTVRKGDRRWVQSARALLRGPAAIGWWHTPDSDRPGEWLTDVIGYQSLPEPMQDGEVANG